MFRKFALAASAAVIGMLAAAAFKSGQHLPEFHQTGSQSAKEDRPTFTSAVAHSAR